MQKFKLQTKMPLSSWIAGFFDHQYLQKELNDLLDFLRRNSHQRNDNSRINTLYL